MASEIQLLRLTTGEDVIGKITKNENTITIEKGCVLYLDNKRQVNQ